MLSWLSGPLNRRSSRADNGRTNSATRADFRGPQRRATRTRHIRDGHELGSFGCAAPHEWSARGRLSFRRRDTRGSTCLLSSSAMPAVAAARSRGSRRISVRPPLSSVMSRSALASTESLQPRVAGRPGGVGGNGCGGGGGKPRRPPGGKGPWDRHRSAPLKLWPRRQGPVGLARCSRCRWRRRALRSRE